MLLANATQFAGIVHGLEAFTILDGLPEGFVMGPDLVERYFGFAIELSAHGWFVLVVRIYDDLFVTEVDCEYKNINGN